MNHNKYKPEFANIAYEMCLLGATTEELARALGICERTFHYWLQEIPEFGEQVRAGREIADRKVAMSLYQKAIGWSHKQEKVFCDPRSGSRQIVEYTERFSPDNTAMIFWLKNRRPDLWRDVRQHEVGKPGDFANLSDAELREKAAALAADLGLGEYATKQPTNQGNGTVKVRNPI